LQMAATNQKFESSGSNGHSTKSTTSKQQQPLESKAKPTPSQPIATGTSTAKSKANGISSLQSQRVPPKLTPTHANNSSIDTARQPSVKPRRSESSLDDLDDADRRLSDDSNDSGSLKSWIWDHAGMVCAAVMVVVAFAVHSQLSKLPPPSLNN